MLILRREESLIFESQVHKDKFSCHFCWLNRIYIPLWNRGSMKIHAALTYLNECYEHSLDTHTHSEVWKVRFYQVARLEWEHPTF